MYEVMIRRRTANIKDQFETARQFHREEGAVDVVIGLPRRLSLSVAAIRWYERGRGRRLRERESYE